MPYVYADEVRHDILRMIPKDGQVIGAFGCGYGTTEATLVKAGRVVHGADIAPEAIEKVRTYLTTAQLIAPDQFDVFPAESLDGLILADVIEHIPRAWDALKSLTRAVRPGGWVVISVPNMRSVSVLSTFFVRGDWPEEPTGIFDATHVQVMSAHCLRRSVCYSGIGDRTMV